MRKAGSSITDDQLIDMLIALEDEYSGKKPEVKLSTAYNNLVEAVEEFNRIDNALIDAGVNPQALQGMQRLDTGMLRGNVPGPYRERLSNGQELRVFLQNADGPAGKEVIPVLDPNDSTTPLSIKYGRAARPQGLEFMNANEEVANIIQKLRGLKSYPRDHNNQGLSDQVVIRNGVPSNADVMVARSDTPTQLIHTYTNLQPTVSTGSDEAFVNRVAQGVKSVGGVPTNAIETLVKQRFLKDETPAKRAGKIVQADRKMVNSDAEVYNELIIPEYTGNQFRTGLLSKITQPPMSIKAVNTNQVLDLIRDGYFEPSQFEYGINRGYNGRQFRRVQQKVRIPNAARAGGRTIVEDVLKTSPITQQTLANDALQKLYVKRPRR